mmetsp:Transcript_12525/g.12314  ORF Transcript_12525/g.12314 Transcript_12525/m.12314 type:complete len:84 (+) Transcript_12525:88-339(+)
MKGSSTEKNQICDITVTLNKLFFDQDEVITLHCAVDNSLCNSDLDNVKIKVKKILQCTNYKLTDRKMESVLIKKKFPLKVKEK